MRPKVLEISWHETQAVYSCDFQSLPPAQLKRLLPLSTEDDERSPTPGPVIAGGRQYRLATAGGDSKVRLWMIHPNILSSSASTHAAVTGQEVAPHPPRAEYLATLSKHTAAVNVVRFSPNGGMLASAGDDGNVILWVPSDRPTVTFGESSSDDMPDKEHWRLQKMLQVTTKHVYDLAWSPDGEFFIAGSTDNTATIWKASTGECVFALREHSHNVQGVSWDPLNEYIATQSSDRSVHVNTFAFRNGVSDVHPISRATRMEVRHSRTPSFPSSTRPSVVRRGSTTSEAGSVVTTASEFTEHALPPSHSNTAAPMTPVASVPSTPQPAPMNPPLSSAKPGSRRSSFSGSQAAGSPSLSAAAFPGRGRSPSPMPPLPAIRAPPPSQPATLQRLYGEEGVTRFFRRLTFSPDGSLLLTPAGQIEDQLFKGSPMLSTRSLSQDGEISSSSVPRPRLTNVDAGKPTVYIYSRANLARAPVAHLPGHKTASVAIRFSPVFYELRPGSAANGVHHEPRQITLDRADPAPVHVSLTMPPPPPPSTKEKEKEVAVPEKEKERPLGSVFALPYRLLYAVACQDSVLLYDTQQAGPIAIFRGLHYAGFTDVAWSPDGQALILSSADGYCSIVVFDMGELGTPHTTQQHHRQLAAIAQSHSHSATTATPTPTPHHHAPTPSVPHSPAISISTIAPTRSEREGSTSSSIAPPPQSSSVPPLFVPVDRERERDRYGAPSSTASTSSVDPVLPTPGEERESGEMFGIVRAESESGIGIGSGEEIRGKRIGEEREKEDGPKKKRRVALTHLGEDVG